VHAVVIERVVGDPAALIPEVAAALGVTAYDVRASLQAPGGGPAILAVHADAAATGAIVSTLRAIGLEASSLDVALGGASIGDFAVRHFELGADALAVDTRDARTAELRYASVDVIVLATSIVSTEHTEIVRERSFSPGRTLLTGGLVNTRTRESTQRSTHVDSEEIAFVFTGGPQAFRFGESALVFQGLGDAMQPARTANFRYLLDQLRGRCATARFDDRLRKRAQQVQLLGRLLSPDEHLGVAVALVAARLRRDRAAP